MGLIERMALRVTRNNVVLFCPVTVAATAMAEALGVPDKADCRTGTIQRDMIGRAVVMPLVAIGSNVVWENALVLCAIAGKALVRFQDIQTTEPHTHAWVAIDKLRDARSGRALTNPKGFEHANSVR